MKFDSEISPLITCLMRSLSSWSLSFLGFNSRRTSTIALEASGIYLLINFSWSGGTKTRKTPLRAASGGLYSFHHSNMHSDIKRDGLAFGDLDRTRNFYCVVLRNFFIE